MGLYKYYEGLPPFAKGVVIIGSMAGAFYGYKKIANYIHDKNASKPIKDYYNNLNNEIETNAKTNPPTLNNTNYLQLASKLYTALNKWSPDVENIYSVFTQMNNDTDVLKLIKSFGAPVDTSSVTELPRQKFLNAFLTSKLSSEEIHQIDYILAHNHIRYRF